MKNIIYLLFVAIFFSNCYGQAQQTIQSGDFQVDFLFEKDGCKIYRFSDGGRYIYWSNCEGRMQNDYTQTTGKTSHTVHVESFTNN